MTRASAFRRVHLARNALAMTVCGLVAAGRAWRPRWSEAPATPQALRCARCLRVLRAMHGRRRPPA